MKILIEEIDKTYLTEEGLRDFIANLRRLITSSGFIRHSVDFDMFNNTLIKFVPDIKDMQETEEEFESKWYVRDIEQKLEEITEMIENGGIDE